jgi:P pilus assembly chaperone PapD
VALVLAGAPLFAVASAWADGLEVVPVQVNLTRATPNALVSVKNDGADETRYQLELFAWGQSREGALELSPSKDLVFFPALFALKPGEQRNLRVGADPALFGPLGGRRARTASGCSRAWASPSSSIRSARPRRSPSCTPSPPR